MLALLFIRHSVFFCDSGKVEDGVTIKRKSLIPLFISCLFKILDTPTNMIYS